jgi:hypothetical protein
VYCVLCIVYCVLCIVYCVDIVRRAIESDTFKIVL